jgi:hypothetical protein
MSTVLTVRLAETELGSCDARAAEMGLTRTDYIRYLIRQDLEQNPKKSRERRFASRDLVGKFKVGAGSTNPAVRSAIASRAREKSR